MKENINFLFKKFKLTAEQVLICKWLKDQNINTDDETLCYWSKTYTPARLKDVVEFVKIRIASGQQIQNVGGFIRDFLKNGYEVVNDTCKHNRGYALEFSKIKNWNDLRIYEKYVKDDVTGDDLPLTIATDEFERSIERLYQKSCLYK